MRGDHSFILLPVYCAAIPRYLLLEANMAQDSRLDSHPLLAALSLPFLHYPTSITYFKMRDKFHGLNTKQPSI